jgi:hypothetical protein
MIFTPSPIIRRFQQENFGAKYRECFAKNWPEGQEVQDVKEARELKEEEKRGRDLRAAIAGGKMKTRGVVRFLREQGDDSSGEVFDRRGGTAGR